MLWIHAHTHTHFINHLTVKERYTALECSFVRGAAPVKMFPPRTNERSDKVLRFPEEVKEERSGGRIHHQVHKLNCNLTELRSLFYIFFFYECLMKIPQILISLLISFHFD